MSGQRLHTADQRMAARAVEVPVRGGDQATCPYGQGGVLPDLGEQPDVHVEVTQGLQLLGATGAG